VPVQASRVVNGSKTRRNVKDDRGRKWCMIPSIRDAGGNRSSEQTTAPCLFHCFPRCALCLLCRWLSSASFFDPALLSAVIPFHTSGFNTSVGMRNIN
jgi:hypothetical protein